MNKYILFTDPEAVKSIRIDLARSGKNGGGYIVKLEQINMDGTAERFQRTYVGKTFGEMGPKLAQVKNHLMKKGIDQSKIAVRSKIMNMNYIPGSKGLKT